MFAQLVRRHGFDVHVLYRLWSLHAQKLPLTPSFIIFSDLFALEIQVFASKKHVNLQREQEAKQEDKHVYQLHYFRMQKRSLSLRWLQS